jgi:hypothetical protein
VQLLSTFVGRGVLHGQHNRSPRPIISVVGQSSYFFIQVALQLSSRGRVDPVPDPLLLRKSGSTGNRTHILWICRQELWPLDHRGIWSHSVKLIWCRHTCLRADYVVISHPKWTDVTLHHGDVCSWWQLPCFLLQSDRSSTYLSFHSRSDLSMDIVILIRNASTKMFVCVGKCSC